MDIDLIQSEHYSDTAPNITGHTALSLWTVRMGELPPGLSLTVPGVLAGTPTTAGSYATLINAKSPNLVNPAELISEVRVKASAGLEVDTTCTTTGFIPVTAGAPVAISGNRRSAFYDPAKGFVELFFDVGPSGSFVYTPPADGFIRVSVKTIDLPTFQVEYGSTQTPYQPYFAPADYLLNYWVSVPGVKVDLTQYVVYNRDVQVLTGDTTSSGWVVREGALPPVLSMNSSGSIYGTPSTLGTFDVTVAPSVSSTSLYPLTFVVEPMVLGGGPVTGSPEALAVAKFLGKPDRQNVVDLAEAHLPVVTAFVRAYVRDKGFTDDEPAQDLRYVIRSATARLVVNPEQAERVTTIDYSETPAILDGFTLPELAILHRYRRRSL